MNDTGKVVRIALIIFLVLALAVGIFYQISRKSRSAAARNPALDIPAPSLDAEKPYALPEPLNLPGLSLATSDDILRRIAQDISSNPMLFNWLKTKDLVRKFVAAVDNVANGLSPKAQIEFFTPRGDFRAGGTRGRFTVDPSSYARYDRVAEVFVSLDTKSSARLYATLLPLFQEAYKDLGYPDRDFQDTLTQAVIEMLRVPVVEGPIYLEKNVASYAFRDEALEGLSAAQKHLLRTGPENIQVIQKKLRELATAIGIPESRLPKTGGPGSKTPN
jgi:hypothetical protein